MRMFRAGPMCAVQPRIAVRCAPEKLEGRLERLSAAAVLLLKAPGGPDGMNEPPAAELHLSL